MNKTHKDESEIAGVRVKWGGQNKLYMGEWHKNESEQRSMEVAKYHPMQETSKHTNICANYYRNIYKQPTITQAPVVMKLFSLMYFNHDQC